MTRAAVAVFTFASRRLQPAVLALICLTASQLAGAVASCIPEPKAPVSLAMRVPLRR